MGTSERSPARSKGFTRRPLTSCGALQYGSTTMRYICLPLLLALVSSIAHAGDWPQTLGPNRDGHAIGEKLPDKFPAAGLKPEWTYTLGSGYAGPAVVGKQVIVFHRIADEEIVEAVDLTT